MFVKELLHRQKHYSPITIDGGSTGKLFFSKDYGKTSEERWRAIREYGNRRVKYFYFATDYYTVRWRKMRKSILLKRLFLFINPQRLFIEVYDE